MIELTPELLQRIESHVDAGTFKEPNDVVHAALDVLESHIRERDAIQAGIEAWRKGNVQDFDEFDREFRAKNNIAADA